MKTLTILKTGETTNLVAITDPKIGKCKSARLTHQSIMAIAPKKFCLQGNEVARVIISEDGLQIVVSGISGGKTKYHDNYVSNDLYIIN